MTTDPFPVFLGASSESAALICLATPVFFAFWLGRAGVEGLDLLEDFLRIKAGEASFLNGGEGWESGASLEGSLERVFGRESAVSFFIFNFLPLFFPLEGAGVASGVGRKISGDLEATGGCGVPMDGVFGPVLANHQVIFSFRASFLLG